jgi:hypothetical protein
MRPLIERPVQSFTNSTSRTIKLQPMFLLGKAVEKLDKTWSFVGIKWETLLEQMLYI